MNEVTISRSEYSRLKEECRLCSASHDEQQLNIKELAEALINSSDALAWLGKHDFALTYKNIANKHLKGK